MLRKGKQFQLHNLSFKIRPKDRLHISNLILKLYVLFLSRFLWELITFNAKKFKCSFYTKFNENNIYISDILYNL